MNPYNSGQQQQPPPPQMGMQQQQMGMPQQQMGMPQQQMGMPQQQMGMPQQNMYPQVQMGPSFCDRWLAQNNPFSRVDKLIPADKAAIYKQIMGVALVAFVMACVDLGVLCVSAGYIGIPHILTVLTPLCDFIFSPSLYAIFCVGNALVLLVILFVNTGQIATCVAAGIVIPLMEIILSGIIIFLLSTMDPELGSRISSFVESCRNPQGGQGPAQMDAMRAPNASMPMPPPTTKPPQARESTARRLMQSMRYNPQPTPASQGGDLPPGWSIAREAGTGDVYYFHTDGRTTWDKPTQ